MEVKRGAIGGTLRSFMSGAADTIAYVSIAIATAGLIRAWVTRRDGVILRFDPGVFDSGR